MKTVGIIGGMGPMATARFYQLLIELTEAHCDQEHLHVIIDSAAELPDRSAHIFGEGESPLEGMICSMRKLTQMGAQIIAMPCNTAHFYYDRLQISVPNELINMVQETVNWVQTQSRLKTIGLLATSGTYRTQLYQRAFQLSSREMVVPTDACQNNLMKAIYSYKEGRQHEAFELIDQVVESLKGIEVDTWLLGCTELPMLFEKYKGKLPMMDSAWILARKTILSSGAKLSKEDENYQKWALNRTS